MIARSELQIFDDLPVQISEETSVWHNIYPIGNYQNGNVPLEFNIKGSTDHYIDLDNTVISLDISITKPDGTAIDIKDEVAPTNCWLASLFADVELYINEVKVQGSNFTYPWKGYLQTLLKYDRPTKQCDIEMYGFAPPTAGKQGTKDDDAFKTLQRKVLGGNKMQIIGPLFLDLFEQHKFMIPMTDLRIKFIRARPEFSLMKFDDKKSYDITLSAARLMIRKVKCLQSIQNAHMTGLRNHHAIYNLNHYDVTSFTINKGSTSEIRDNLFPDRLPKLLLVALVSNSSFTGNYSESPFKFHHYDLNFLNLIISGNNVYREFTPNFEESLAGNEYFFFQQSLGYFGKNRSNDIDINDYVNGCTIFGFNLCPTQVINEVQPLKKESIRMEMKFAKALPHTINVLLYSVTDRKLEISKLGTVEII